MSFLHKNICIFEGDEYSSQLLSTLLAPMVSTYKGCSRDSRLGSDNISRLLRSLQFRSMTLHFEALSIDVFFFFSLYSLRDFPYTREHENLCGENALNLNI